MTIYDLPNEQRIEITKKICNIIGEQNSWITDNMSLSQRIEARENWRKLFEKLAKVWVKYGDKALAMNYTDKGSLKIGTTPSGKKWALEMNNGWTMRSRHCGALYIEGEGTVFTSGTLARAFERILEN